MFGSLPDALAASCGWVCFTALIGPPLAPPCVCIVDAGSSGEASLLSRSAFAAHEGQCSLANLSIINVASSHRDMYTYFRRSDLVVLRVCKVLLRAGVPNLMWSLQNGCACPELAGARRCSATLPREGALVSIGGGGELR